MKAEDLDSLDESEGEGMEEAEEEKEKALPKIKGHTLEAVALLSKTRRYREHLEKVQSGMSVAEPPPMSMPLESDPEYQLIVSSNKLVQGTSLPPTLPSYLYLSTHPPTLIFFFSLSTHRHRRGDHARASVCRRPV